MTSSQVLRILIIDDKVENLDRASSYFGNVLKAIAYSVAVNNGTEWARLSSVEIVLVPSPQEGIELWRSTVYDITLVDSSFPGVLLIEPEEWASRGANPIEKKATLKRSVSYKYAGIDIFWQLHEWMDEDFACRRDYCDVLLWSALEREGVSTYLSNRFPGETEGIKELLEKTYIPKAGIRLILERVEKAARRCLENRQRSPEEVFDRLVSLCRNGYVSPSTRYRFLWLDRGHHRHVGYVVSEGKQCAEENCHRTFPVDTMECTSCNGGVEDVQLRGTYLLPSVSLGGVDLGLRRESERYMDALLGNLRSGRGEFNDGGEARAHQMLIRKVSPTYIKGGRRGNGNTVARGGERDVGIEFLEYLMDRTRRGGLGSSGCRPAYVAAASPVTGSTMVGLREARAALVEKVDALLSGAFEAVVLKTTYLDSLERENSHLWPSLQVQSRIKTRCLRPPEAARVSSTAKTLWNSGTTKTEMFPPREMGRVLCQFVERGGGDRFGDCFERVIVSLGSKFPTDRSRWEGGRKGEDDFEIQVESVWSRLFEDVFGEVSRVIPQAFPLVEINVRHYLRYSLGYYFGSGDEYLSPLAPGRDSAVPPLGGQRGLGPVLQEFRCWIRVLNTVAKRWRKDLLLKFPFRSDLFAFLDVMLDEIGTGGLVCPGCRTRNAQAGVCSGCDRAYRPGEHAIKGIVLINTIKLPLPVRECVGAPLSWSYSHADAWNDGEEKRWKYQMSGEGLSIVRRQLYRGLRLLDRRFPLHILLGGGFTSQEECVSACRSLEVPITAFQLATLPLMRLNIGSKGLDGFERADFPQVATLGSKFSWRSWPASLEVGELAKPSSVKKFWPRLRYEMGGAKHSSGFEVRLIGFHPDLCIDCGDCSRTYYCDSFLDRTVNGRPVLDARNCTGCGLCVQACPVEALQLYKPSDFVVLLSRDRRCREILLRHAVPHLSLDPGRIPAEFHSGKLVILSLGQDVEEMSEKEMAPSDVLEAVKAGLSAWRDYMETECGEILGTSTVVFPVSFVEGLRYRIPRDHEEVLENLEIIARQGATFGVAWAILRGGKVRAGVSSRELPSLSRHRVTETVEALLASSAVRAYLEGRCWEGRLGGIDGLLCPEMFGLKYNDALLVGGLPMGDWQEDCFFSALRAGMERERVVRRVQKAVAIEMKTVVGSSRRFGT